MAASIPGDSIGIFRINKVNENRYVKPESNEKNKTQSGSYLTVKGFTEDG
jgi:hypothetical protein